MSETLEELIGRVIVSLQNAENHTSSLSDDVLSMPGMSSKKVRHFLNNICSYRGIRYLEVGSAAGSTFISSMKNNEVETACVIDIWAEGKNGKNGKDVFLDNCKTYLGRAPEQVAVGGEAGMKLISGDCFSVDTNEIGKKYNVFLYDAGHEVEDHRKSMTYFNDVLDDNFIMIVDDWNDSRVQKGTAQGLEESGLKIKFMHYCPASPGTTPPSWGDTKEWWNGLMVFVLTKPTPL